MTEFRQTREQPTESLETPAGLMPVKVESAPLRQKIVAALRRAIELGTLKAGDRLIEKDLCAKLNVSRTSLREALRDLEANGVITNLSVRGMVVTPLTREDIISMYRVRRAIESLLAEQFIKWATDHDVAELRAALDRLRAAAPSQTASLDAHRNYYEVWGRAARNLFAFELLMNIYLRLSVIRSNTLTPDLLKQNVEGKMEVLECMAKRDVAAAQVAVRRHVKNATVAALEGVGMLPIGLSKAPPSDDLD